MSDKEIKPLQHKYDVWFRGINRGKAVANTQNYDQNLKIVASFDTVQSFWSVYSHLIRPNGTNSFTLHVFKSGIKPLWEDEANKDGGMLKLRLRKGLASRLWESLLLAFIGEQFMVGDDICGIVVACRSYEDYLCVWNRTGSDPDIRVKIRDTFKRVLNLPSSIILEYKLHSDALRKCTNTRGANKPKNLITAT